MSKAMGPRNAATSRTARSERRVVSLMFCDVANSTALAENIDPEEWVEIMNEAFEKMTAPILRYEGTIGKFTGDGLMAFFGAPVSHEDDPERAVRAGLEILEGIEEIRESVRADYGLEFNIRVGVNTGLAVVGQVGTSTLSEYTAMGDAVNVAARMEQTAEPGTLQISADTQKLVENSFTFESLGGMEVKGKSAPVEGFKVTSALLQTEVSRNIVAPLIGRDDELNELVRLMNLSKNGYTQVVSIIGEAGLGKSRLLSELQKEWFKTSSPHTWEFTQGIPYDVNRPYSLFQNLVRGMFGVELDDPPDVIHGKVDKLLRAEGGTD